MNYYLLNKIIKILFSLGECYLDHAGATLYSERQISGHLSDLKGNLYGNPHAKSNSSKDTEDKVDQVRFE